MKQNQSPQQQQQIHHRFLETKHRIFANNRLDFQKQLDTQMAKIQYLGTDANIKETMNQKVYAILYGNSNINKNHHHHGQQQQCQTETSQEIMKKVCLQDQRKASYERYISANEHTTNKNGKVLPSLQNRSTKRMQQFIEQQNKSKRSTSQNSKVADLSPSYSTNKLNMTTRDLTVKNCTQQDRNSADNLEDHQNPIRSQKTYLQDESGFISTQNKLSAKRNTLNNSKQPLKTSYFNVSSYFNWKKSSQSPPPPLRQNQLKNQQLTLQNQITFEKDLTSVDVTLPEKRHSYACFSQERDSSLPNSQTNNKYSKRLTTKYPDDFDKYIKGNETTSITSNHKESTRPFSRTFQKASQNSANDLSSLPIKTDIISRNKLTHKEDANLMSSLFGKKKISTESRKSEETQDNKEKQLNIEDVKEELDNKILMQSNNEQSQAEIKQTDNSSNQGRLRNNGQLKKQEGYYKDIRRSFERVYRQETQIESGRQKKQKKQQNLKDMWADCDTSGTQLSLCSRKIQMMLTRRSVVAQLNPNNHQSLQAEQIANSTSVQSGNSREKEINQNGNNKEQNIECKDQKTQIFDNESLEINVNHSTESQQIFLPNGQTSETTKSCSPWRGKRQTAYEFDKKSKLKSSLQVKKQIYNSQDSWGLDPWEMTDMHQESDILLLRNLKKTFEIQGIEESEEDLTKWNINQD